MRVFDLERPEVTLFSGNTQEDSISSLCYSEEFNLLICGSWDKTLSFYDIRRRSPANVFKLKEKVLVSDTVSSKLIVGLKHTELALIDLNKMS